MRVAIVSHNAIKGDGQGWVVFSLAKGFVEKGYDVHIYANRIDEELLKLKNLHYHHIPVFIKRPMLLKVIIFAVIASVVLKFKKYDIVHLHGFTAFVKHDLNTSHFVHSSWLEVMGKVEKRTPLYPYHWFYTFLNSIFEKIVYKKAKVVIAVSSMVKRELVKCGIPENKITIIHNGVDKKYWKRIDVDRNYLKNYGIIDEFVILFAGDLKLEIKGLRYILYALKNLEGVKLLIAGDERRSRFKGLIKELNLEEKAIHIGWIRDMRKLYSAVDCLVFPSLYDSCPLTVIEACACGCPVVVSSSEFVGAEELLKDGESGLIIKNPLSPEEIKEKIMYLKENPDLRKKISENAPSVVPSVEEMVEKYLFVYRKVWDI